MRVKTDGKLSEQEKFKHHGRENIQCEKSDSWYKNKIKLKQTNSELEQTTL